MRRAVLGAMLLGMAGASGSPALAGAPGTIADGTYHCIAGGTRMMLTLGDMDISGTGYVFQPPSGPSTTGSYSFAGTGIRWSGDIGAIGNEQIVESGLDATPGSFYFRYKVRPTSLPTTAACRHL